MKRRRTPKPEVPAIPDERYERLRKAWDEPFKVIDRIRDKNRGKDPVLIHRDVTAAVAEVRATARTKAWRRA